MDTSKLLKWWHIAGIAATTVGALATQLQPLTATFPKLAPIVTGLGAVSLAVTMIMNKVAEDKVVSAIINDPTSPTPQGFGIPKPDALLGQVAASAASGDQNAAHVISSAAIASNVIEHARVVVENQK